MEPDEILMRPDAFDDLVKALETFCPEGYNAQNGDQITAMFTQFDMADPDELSKEKRRWLVIQRGSEQDEEGAVNHCQLKQAAPLAPFYVEVVWTKNK